jgi:hypothetical protein
MVHARAGSAAFVDRETNPDVQWPRRSADPVSSAETLPLFFVNAGRRLRRVQAGGHNLTKRDVELAAQFLRT